MNALHGHQQTLRPFVRALVRPPVAVPSRHLRVPFVDPVRGPIAITARVGPEPAADTLIVIHGLGGSASSPYTSLAARAAERVGMGCVRMNMRGADRGGDDVYHGGLAEDVATLLASPEFAHVERFHLVGYSLGGHLALSYAASRHDPRLASVVSVCAPLDFDHGARVLDRPSGTMYRGHLLRGLREVHRAASARMPIGCDVKRASRIRSLREWDALIVAPRYGFASAEDYYAKVSVGPRLGDIRVPALMLVADHDPMVRLETVLPSATAASNVHTIRSQLGGHVGFPPGTDLGFGTPGSVEDQLVAWALARRAG